MDAEVSSGSSPAPGPSRATSRSHTRAPSSSLRRSLSPLRRPASAQASLAPGTSYRRGVSKASSGRVSFLTQQLEEATQSVGQSRQAVEVMQKQTEEAVATAQQAALSTVNMRSAVESALQHQLSQASELSQKQIQDLTAKTMAGIQGTIQVQQQQVQRIQEQEQEITQLKADIQRMKDAHAHQARSVAMQEETRSQAMQSELEYLKQQIELLQAQKQLGEVKLDSLSMQLTQDRETQQSDTNRTLLQMQREMQSMRRELENAQQSRVELEHTVQSMLDYEPEYENEVGARREAAHNNEEQPVPTISRTIPSINLDASQPTSTTTPSFPLFPTNPMGSRSTMMQPSPFPPMQIKPRDPATFKGNLEEDVEAWLLSLQDYQRFTQMTDEQTIGYAIMLLQDKARIWWNACMRRTTIPTTMDHFIQLMKARFQSTVHVRKARAEIRIMSQRGGESVRAYSSRFLNTLAKIPNYDEEDMTDKFVGGLRGIVRIMTATAKPRTVGDAISQAEEVETFAAVDPSTSRMQGGTSGSRPLRHKNTRGKFYRSGFHRGMHGNGGRSVRPVRGRTISSGGVASFQRPPQRSTYTTACSHCGGNHNSNNCWRVYGPPQHLRGRGNPRGAARSGRSGRGGRMGTSGATLASYHSVEPMHEAGTVQQPPASSQSEPPNLSGNA